MSELPPSLAGLKATLEAQTSAKAGITALATEYESVFAADCNKALAAGLTADQIACFENTRSMLQPHPELIDAIVANTGAASEANASGGGQAGYGSTAGPQLPGYGSTAGQGQPGYESTSAGADPPREHAAD